MTSSAGEVLYHEYGLCQGSYFRASIVSQDRKQAWIKSFVKEAYRNRVSKVNNNSLMVVLSQDCDISCSKDEVEACVELVVCKQINKPYETNTFVRSVRKLHLENLENWYEASVDYILTVEKADLLELLSKEEVFHLSDEYQKQIPVWRANRYQRTALPNALNKVLQPVLKEHLPSLQETAKATDENFSSYIRAIYIWIDSLEEKEAYDFEIFALMHETTSDEVLSLTQDTIELMATDVLASQAGYIDSSSMYADRDSNTYVSYLTRFVRINLDYVSLAEGDDDTGPE